MRVRPSLRPADTTPVLQSLADGFRYVRSFVPVRSGLLLVALISVLGMPFQVLMPVMASDVLGGGAHTLGMLMTTTGLGALLGTLYLASRQTVVGLGRKIAQASTCFGIGLVVFSLSHNLWLSLLVLPIVGAGFMISLAATNTIVQTIVPEDLRGRVMAFYAMSFLGTAPIGSLIAGSRRRAHRRAGDDHGRRHLLHRLRRLVLLEPSLHPRRRSAHLHSEGPAGRSRRGYGSEDAVIGSREQGSGIRDQGSAGIRD